MGLRRQLLLFGSLSLALPMAGVQYVKEMEAALRYGQAMALQATAQAVAARIASDPALLEAVTQSEPSVKAIYAHPVQAPLPVDGYDDDWRSLDYQWQLPRALGNFSSPPTMQVVRHDNSLHLLVIVPDSDRRYFDPATNMDMVDRIEILLPVEGANATQHLRLFAAAPGPVVVESSVAGGQWQRDHRVQAVWNEREDSYLVEIKMPFAAAKNGLAVAAINGGESQDWPARDYIRSLETRNDALDATLQTFSREGVRLYLVNRGGWITAKAGALQSQGQRTGLSSLQRHWVRRFVAQADLPMLGDAERRGAFATGEFQQLLEREPSTRWYQYGEGVVGRTLQPVATPAGVVAVVVAEQTTDSLDQLTSGAVGRLFFYSAAASLLAAIGLLGFASVLSYRVRRLSLQAQGAVDRDGRISGSFSGSRRSDELGELSRQYSALLERLRNYTQYLETLASKLSHELRTPLAIVKSSLDNLSQVPLSEEAQTYLARAADGSNRLSAILNAMSAAARLEQSIHNSDKELVDLKEMLPVVVAAYNDLYQPTPITLTVTGENKATALIAPDLFVQMLDKLIDNAVDFSEVDSAVEVHLLCSSRDIAVRIVNRGPPIPESMLDTIFDSLVSARESHTRTEHLGLGLYVVRLIATFHQAQLRAVNDVKEGKVYFEVVLPR